MILLVPIAPEVPKRHLPRLIPGLVFVLLLSVAFLEVYPTLKKDSEFVADIVSLAQESGSPTIDGAHMGYLQLRPLLKYAPARGDWDLQRLLMANFIHGSLPHLFLNLIATFAGARICATFLPLPVIFCLFLIGGSFGLFGSMMLSQEQSHFIPHVGSSAGIFALMGTYYIFNFRFRTRYFFWFPSRKGTLISLNTSWFFFVDVILLELFLATGQFFPNNLDGVDHLAHVFGFFTGVLSALFLRFVNRWPWHVHTRSEYNYWAYLYRPVSPRSVNTDLEKWFSFLEINPFNDQIKHKAIALIQKSPKKFSDAEIHRLFSFLGATYIRLHSVRMAQFLKRLFSEKRPLPEPWLANMPYDVIITLSKCLATTPEEQHYIYALVSHYRLFRARRGIQDPKLELLLQKLEGLIPRPEKPSETSPPQTSDSATSDSAHSSTRKQRPPGTAKKTA